MDFIFSSTYQAHVGARNSFIEESGSETRVVLVFLVRLRSNKTSFHQRARVPCTRHPVYKAYDEQVIKNFGNGFVRLGWQPIPTNQMEYIVGLLYLPIIHRGKEAMEILRYAVVLLNALALLIVICRITYLGNKVTPFKAIKTCLEGEEVPMCPRVGGTH
jgi:hypothetical protein